jgi:hypothetical protein
VRRVGVVYGCRFDSFEFLVSVERWLSSGWSVRFFSTTVRYWSVSRGGACSRVRLVNGEG